MKYFKKMMAFAIALVIVVAMAIPAMAGTITVDDALEGETYTAYKILNYTSDTTVDPAAYSYYLTTAQYDSGLGTLLEGAGFKFTASADGTQYFVNNADEITDGAKVADYLYGKKDQLETLAIDSEEVKATADADSDGTVTAKFVNLDPGYWFVTSSLGALCSLQSYDDEALIVEKNEMLPPPEKEVSDTEAQVGDVLDYTITLTDAKGSNLEAKIVDTMSEGLTYNKDAELVATIDGTERTLVADTDYTETVTGTTVVTWTISAALMTEMDEGETIVVTYSATVNNAASIDGTELNTAVIEYSEQEIKGVPVEVETTWLKINKTDGSEALKGAKFELYREVEGAQVPVNITEMTDAEIAKVLEGAAPAADTIYYKVDTESTSNVIDMTDASSAYVYGLDKDSTYYLTEIVAPDGYNLLDEQVKVVLESANEIDVVNEAGAQLPSTGSIGTTIFYVLGSILVIGAGILLVTRRRMNAE